MRKITKEELIDCVVESGDMEKEHRKGSTFYAWVTYTITSDDVEMFKSKGIDISDLLDVSVTVNGIWSDYDGFDGYDLSFSKFEKRVTHVPEVIIPAHDVTEFVQVSFKYEV